MGNETVAPEIEKKLSAAAHIMCGWPLALVAVGGAIGGGLGGGAYGINLVIYKSRLPVAAKIALNLLAGASAIFIWWLIMSSTRKGLGQ